MFFPQAAGLDPAHRHRRRHPRRRAECILQPFLTHITLYPSFGPFLITFHPCHASNCQFTTSPLSFHRNARTNSSVDSFQFLFCLLHQVLQLATLPVYLPNARSDIKAREGLLERQAPSAAFSFPFAWFHPFLSLSLVLSVSSRLALRRPSRADEPFGVRELCSRNPLSLVSYFSSHATRSTTRSAF